MFQAIRNSENGESYIYNVLRVDKERRGIVFLVEFGGDLLWLNSNSFVPYITSEKTMPTFTIKGTNYSQVFYAAIPKSYGQIGYDLIYYDGKWKVIPDNECIINASSKLN